MAHRPSGVGKTANPPIVIQALDSAGKPIAGLNVAYGVILTDTVFATVNP